MRADDADPRIRFAGHRYDDEHRCLVHDDGTEIALRPKTLAAFRTLAAHADRVVDRESLHDTVWGDAVVTDDSIGKCVAEIRRAIGDTAHEVLRTVPCQGYLLVSDTPPTGGQPRPTRWIRRSPAAAPAAALVGALVGAITLAIVHRTADGPVSRAIDPAGRTPLDALLATARDSPGERRTVTRLNGAAGHRLSLALCANDADGGERLALALARPDDTILFAGTFPVESGEGRPPATDPCPPGHLPDRTRAPDERSPGTGPPVVSMSENFR